MGWWICVSGAQEFGGKDTRVYLPNSAAKLEKTERLCLLPGGTRGNSYRARIARTGFVIVLPAFLTAGQLSHHANAGMVMGVPNDMFARKPVH